MNLTCVAYKTYEKQWFSRKYTPWGGHRKIRKSGFGTTKESYEKLKPPGAGFAYKTNQKQWICSPQASCNTKGVSIIAWGLG